MKKHVNRCLWEKIAKDIVNQHRKGELLLQRRKPLINPDHLIHALKKDVYRS